MRVAICEDNAKEALEIRNHITSYFKDTTNIHIELFDSGEPLIKRVEDGCFFDVVILDIYLPAATGIVVAKELRKLDATVMIIFVTRALAFAPQGYDVDAISYLVKPININTLAPVLDKVYERVIGNRKTITINTSQYARKLYLSEILFVEKIRKKSYIALAHESVETNYTIKQLSPILHNHDGFLVAGQGTIVNYNFIAYIDKRARVITLTNGRKITVSRDRLKEFMDDYIALVTGSV